MNEMTIGRNIKQNASNLGRGTTRILLELYYVLKDPTTSVWDKTIIVSALGYQFLPNQLLSKEKHGVFGYADNVATLMIAYNKVKKRVTPQIAVQVDMTLNQWFGYTTIDYDNRYMY